MWVYIEEDNSMFNTNDFSFIGVKDQGWKLYGINNRDSEEEILYAPGNKSKVRLAFGRIRLGLETYKGLVTIDKEIISESPNKMDISNLGLSARTLNPLVRNGINSVEHISKIGIKGLKKIDGLGPKAIDEIVEKVNGILM